MGGGYRVWVLDWAEGGKVVFWVRMDLSSDPGGLQAMLTARAFMPVVTGLLIEVRAPELRDPARLSFLFRFLLPPVSGATLWGSYPVGSFPLKKPPQWAMRERVPFKNELIHPQSAGMSSFFRAKSPCTMLRTQRLSIRKSHPPLSPRT